jgi:prefoldin subunit 5
MEDQSGIDQRLPETAGGTAGEGTAPPDPIQASFEAASPPEAPVEEKPRPAPPVTPRPALVSRSQAVWIALGSGLLTLCLSVSFVLFFLSTINGGLRYARPSQVSVLQAQVEGMSLQAEALQADLEQVQAGLDDLKGLGARVSAVEEAAGSYDKELEEAAAQVDEFKQKIDELSLQVDALLTRVGRFQNFLDGLREMLGDLALPAPEAEVP